MQEKKEDVIVCKEETDTRNRMVQAGLFPNCNGSCDFCLREERLFYDKPRILQSLEMVGKNIQYLDFTKEFTCGVSLLGGEVYFMTDPDYQEAFMKLIDIIIEHVLKKSPNPHVKYSTVTNGNYDPTFLYKVIDKIVAEVGIQAVDLNFSYDMKYRFKNEEQRLRVLKNINDFHKRYDYRVGVQMILTQYVIDMWKRGEFEVNKFIEENIPGNNLCFLYPHPVKTGLVLPDFNFKRSDLLEFVRYLKKENEFVYASFVESTKNSAVFKYTLMRDRTKITDYTQRPELSDGKDVINTKCGHSVLYKCYSDCDNCMLCDLMMIDGGEHI